MIILFLIFFLLIVSFEIVNIINSNEIKCINLIRIIYAFCYGFIPLIVYINKSDIYKIDSNSFLFFLFSIIGYLFLNIGYLFKSSKKIKIKKGHSIFLTANVCLIIVVIMILIWTKPYGGVIKALDYANIIRMGISKINNPYSFLLRFFSLSLFCSYLYFIELLKKEKKYKYIKLMLFFFSIMISIYTMLINDSRIMIGFYLMTLMLISIFDKKKEGVPLKIIVRRVAIYSFFILVIVINADYLYKIVKGVAFEVESTSFIEKVSSEFSFIIEASKNSMNYVFASNKLRIIDDVFSIPFAVLPSSIIKNPFVSVWNFNSSIAGGYGQSPTDIISTSLYELSFVGPVIVPFFYGMFIKIIDNISRSKNEINYQDVIFIILMIFAAKFIIYFEYYNAIANLFFLFIGHIIFKLINSKKIKIY
ncbi:MULTISPECIES: hypothetical protein [Coprobacillaceae]|uniref:hypothetical protein n=1 Tax=Coprobacillaceae TaxID=2810280 RepID=UPI000E4EF6EC|nr:MULTISPECIES: hypothetical protein [Coprobacillaceae]RHM62809.1 hypothetical protein DWZ53_01940 [Coprobacillus sp. AF33-1AC]RHS96106.1 hypothetical protein DW911_01880 [Erysipelatoclostridium sp. AM42-17]